MSREPRINHYELAHRTLPHLMRGNPQRALEILSGSNADAFLREVWVNIGSTLPADDQLPAAGLGCALRSHGDYAIAVITPPPPQGMTEAHFVACAFGPASDLLDGLPLGLRYITLELGFSLDGTARTVLGEWTEVAHLNMGDGPPPQADAFFDAVCALLDGPAEVRGATNFAA